jgi:hypothetical protein
VSWLFSAGQDYTSAVSAGNDDVRQSLDSTQGAIDVVRHASAARGTRSVTATQPTK